MSKKLLYYLSGLLLFCPNLAALAVTIYTNLPGQPSGISGLGNFVDYLYRFAMMLAGILAFGAIVYGGIKYTLAAGNPTGQTEGKEWVKGALIGLLLLVGAYTILNIINPNLTSWNFLLSGVSVSTSAAPQTSCTPACPTGEICQNGTCVLGGGTTMCQSSQVGTTSPCPAYQICEPYGSNYACVVECGAGGGKYNAACPTGQTCVNQGDSVNPNYSCVSNTSFTCGGDPPNSHFGDCAPGTGTCQNANGGLTPSTVRYQCQT